MGFCPISKFPAPLSSSRVLYRFPAEIAYAIQAICALLGGTMSRRIAVVVILIAALLAATTIFAQQRSYNLIMKDIQTTFASLKKNLDASGVAAAPAAPAGRGAAPAAEEAAGGRGGAAAPHWDDSVRDATVQ